MSDRQLRIVLVAYHGSVHTRRWARLAAGLGHDVHVVTCHGSKLFPDEIDDIEAEQPLPYTVHDVGSLRWGKFSYLLRAPKARRVIRNLAPDVVHAHYLTSCGLHALVSGVRPLVCTAHGDDLLLSPRNPLLRMLLRRVLRAASLITLPSNEMRDVARQLLGNHSVPIAVVQYGVDAPALERLGNDVRAARDAGVLRIVGARAFLPYCNNDVLVRALALLDEDTAGWRCDLLSDGPELDRVRELANELGVADRVTFHGRIEPEQAHELIAASDIYISLAERDGASIGLLEAMAAGCVPVAADIESNQPWVEQGSSGVLVDPRDPAAVAQAIAQAAGLPREQAREHNRAMVRQRGDQDTNFAVLDTLVRELVPTAP